MTTPTDLVNVESLLSPEEIATRDRVRAFEEARIRPNIAQWFEEAIVPTELFKELADEGLFGMHLDGYGCPGKTAVEYGLAMQELEAGDS